MPKWLDISTRLLLMSAFFVGLFWAIRMESVWRVTAGIALMVLSVPLNFWLIDQTRAPKQERQSFKQHLSAVLPMTGPIIIMFVVLAVLTYVGKTGDKRALFMILLIMLPLANVLVDVFQGTLPRDPVVIAQAYTRVITRTLSVLLVVLGGLAVLAAAVAGGITLLMTAGDLLWQWLVADQPSSAPLLCRLQGIDDDACASTLLVWHGATIAISLAGLFYGEKLVDWIADLTRKIYE